MLSVGVTECKPLSERIKNVEANYIMQSGKWILSAYQFSRKWDNENNAIRRNLNAWVRPALRFVHQQQPEINIYVLISGCISLKKCNRLHFRLHFVFEIASVFYLASGQYRMRLLLFLRQIYTAPQIDRKS